MAYPNEKASKINHKHIIENSKIEDYLSRCEKLEQNIPLEELKTIAISNIHNKISSCIECIITIDGSYQEINIDKDFFLQKLCYYSIGALSFHLKDLEAIQTEQTINPSNINKLENLQRFHFVMPIQNIHLKDGDSIKDFMTTFRETLHEAFLKNYLHEAKTETALIHTIKWLVFKEYADSDSKGRGSISFACPHCKTIQTFQKQTPHYLDDTNNFMLCRACQNIIYITDCFSLHSFIDEANGAVFAESYIMSVFEVILLLSIFRTYFEQNLQSLPKTLFIKDGPLALFNKLDDFAFKVVRPFVQFLYAKSLHENISYINLVGLDKGGMFAGHFKNIESKIPLGSILLPNLDYMKKYITGKYALAFGEKPYFGVKMFVRNTKKLSFVLDVALPFTESTAYKDYIKQPKIDDFLCLKSILDILLKLECDLYQKSFIPVAMINKLVSLSNIPSKKILALFSQENL